MMELVEKVSSMVPVEHEGERVITLAQMDEMHERVVGTAGRNFRRHRSKLLEGRHFFAVVEDSMPDEFRRAKNGGARGDTKLILLTERGYLVLVKSFQDDLAWQVQETLVEHYFRSKEQLPSGHLMGRDFVAGMQEAIQDSLRDGLKPVNEKVDQLDEKVETGFSDLNQRLDHLEKRRQLTANTKRQHIETVVQYFGGKCPCCQCVDVVDEYHGKTLDANWEHWFGKSKNNVHQTWLTCRDCNQRLESDGSFKRDSQVAFDNYQRRREQKFLPLLPEFNNA